MERIRSGCNHLWWHSYLRTTSVKCGAKAGAWETAYAKFSEVAEGDFLDELKLYVKGDLKDKRDMVTIGNLKVRYSDDEEFVIPKHLDLDSLEQNRPPDFRS